MFKFLSFKQDPLTKFWMQYQSQMLTDNINGYVLKTSLQEAKISISNITGNIKLKLVFPSKEAHEIVSYTLW